MVDVEQKVKLHIPAGEATPAPPIGPALAEYGIDIGKFCNQFNEKTKDQKGFTIPVEITIYEDKSFDFEVSTPLTSELLKEEVGINKGSGAPNSRKVGTVTRKQLEKVAKKKMEDLNTNDLDQAVKIVKGTAKNMGLEIEE